MRRRKQPVHPRRGRGTEKVPAELFRSKPRFDRQMCRQVSHSQEHLSGAHKKQHRYPQMDIRSINCREHEDGRRVARDIAKTKQYEVSMERCKRVEMLFAHLKRILGQNRLKSRRSRGTNENICSQPQPKSSANWQKSLPRRSKREKGEQKGTRVVLSVKPSTCATRLISHGIGGERPFAAGHPLLLHSKIERSFISVQIRNGALPAM